VCDSLHRLDFDVQLEDVTLVVPAQEAAVLVCAAQGGVVVTAAGGSSACGVLLSDTEASALLNWARSSRVSRRFKQGTSVVSHDVLAAIA
jgi:hypothetical protein